jgi:rRNA maturation endonuclease Nob1
MTWHLACDDCSRDLEIKTIGIFRWPDDRDTCEVCGKTIPRHPNGTPAGHPLYEEQFQKLKADKENST